MYVLCCCVTRAVIKNSGLSVSFMDEHKSGMVKRSIIIYYLSILYNKAGLFLPHRGNYIKTKYKGNKRHYKNRKYDFKKQNIIEEM